MCYTYDKSKGGDTRELQSRMVPPEKNWVEYKGEQNEALSGMIFLAAQSSLV